MIYLHFGNFFCEEFYKYEFKIELYEETFFVGFVGALYRFVR